MSGEASKTRNDRPESGETSGPTHGSCPVCKAAVTSEVATLPFCSARCRKIDLGRWMDERYVVSRPVEQADLDALE